MSGNAADAFDHLVAVLEREAELRPSREPLLRIWINHLRNDQRVLRLVYDVSDAELQDSGAV
jgi:hypothetical protein